MTPLMKFLFVCLDNHVLICIKKPSMVFFCVTPRDSGGALSSQGDPSEPAITTQSNVVGDTPRTQELHSCHWANNGYEPSSNHDIYSIFVFI